MAHRLARLVYRMLKYGQISLEPLMSTPCSRRISACYAPRHLAQNFSLKGLKSNFGRLLPEAVAKISPCAEAHLRILLVEPQMFLPLGFTTDGQ